MKVSDQIQETAALFAWEEPLLSTGEWTAQNGEPVPRMIVLQTFLICWNPIHDFLEVRPSY
jgi:hypothetical protein